jgi:hypothetical protein
MTVRDIEVKLTSLEDNILNNLGYREYTIAIGATELTIKPEVIQKSIRGYSDGQMQRFIDAMGGQGNPIAFFQIALSRDISESLVRQYDYWTLIRDGLVAKGLLVDLIVEDARYIATVGVIKISGEMP